MIQTQQEDREWKQQVDALQNDLQTFTKQTEFLRQQVETLQQTVCIEIIWCATPVAMNGRHSTTEEHSNSHLQPERLLNLSTPNTTSAFYDAKSWILSKKASHQMRTKEVGNVLWKIQLCNVLWKSGHIPNSVCFHRSSLIKTSCTWLIWIIIEQRWLINEQLRALLLSLNHCTQRVE